jgi:hypothetical protein
VGGGPSGDERQVEVGADSPMNQFVRTSMTGVPRTVPSQVNDWAATCPGLIGPMGESMGAVATATS